MNFNKLILPGTSEMELFSDWYTSIEYTFWKYKYSKTDLINCCLELNLSGSGTIAVLEDRIIANTKLCKSKDSKFMLLMIKTRKSVEDDYHLYYHPSVSDLKYILYTLGVKASSKNNGLLSDNLLSQVYANCDKIMGLNESKWNELISRVKCKNESISKINFVNYISLHWYRAREWNQGSTESVSWESYIARKTKIKTSKSENNSNLKQISKNITTIISSDESSDEQTSKNTIPNIISKKRREEVWDRWIGSTVGVAMCLLCCKNQIKQGGCNDWDCGHVISRKNGGDISVDNLRPICKGCNSSMGSKNIDDYCKLYEKNSYILKTLPGAKDTKCVTCDIKLRFYDHLNGKESLYCSKTCRNKIIKSLNIKIPISIINHDEEIKLLLNELKSIELREKEINAKLLNLIDEY